MRCTTLALAATLATWCAMGAHHRPACRFAPDYTSEQIWSDEAVAKAFLDAHAAWEYDFVNGLGVDPLTQLTYDGHRLDFETGEPLGLPHLFSAPSKESVHVGLLARYLADQAAPEAAPRGNRSQAVFASVSAALATLGTKADSIERFNAEFPGFGGFLPWFAFRNETVDGANVTRVSPISPGWDNRVPALDNGEMFWSAFAVAHVLAEHHPTATTPSGRPLAAAWTTIWQRMVNNSVTVFYAGNGSVRCVTRLSNQSAPVAANTYASDGGCTLDDPYEGELFVDMMTLLVPDALLPAADKALIWERKRGMLQAANLTVADRGAIRNITVQRGFWFSAHEQWKYMLMPYRQSAVNWRVFRNGEAARTWYASVGGRVAGGAAASHAEQPSPGMWASVTSPVTSNADNFDYFSACGIAPVAFQPVQHDDVVTPYSSFPLLLLDDQRAGAAWLHRMILARKGQNRFGTTESLNVTGRGVGSLTTWDSKGTTLLASVGGISDLTARYLGGAAVARFLAQIDEAWTRVFPEAVLPGADLSPQPPAAFVPEYLADYTTCDRASN
uniref:Endo-beta-1,2-glucanase SGL domain-containing protein n=1 Tax=Neobodo designis TaxID=312471 RepID=A0A7S1MIX3_NEODS